MGLGPKRTNRWLPLHAHGPLARPQVLRRQPRASLYHNFKDKISPLLQAAGGAPGLMLASSSICCALVVYVWIFRMTMYARGIYASVPTLHSHCSTGTL